MLSHGSQNIGQCVDLISVEPGKTAVVEEYLYGPIKTDVTVHLGHS